ncbi:site-specific integrase [Tropicimonas sp. IMCC6043]|uniref:tyrosine-type recombinase/integrase n=1 Tax=Tropicimonas sp. IMCC6043 TaxID=2510645 RepID=UPI00101C4057|nr:site-specific integrase [Tropicimonas sp. IMCC6043]RYH06236.1 site-specific integrase [Tropicimonas sp. IMCC6043]
MKQAKLLAQAEQKRVSALIDAHRYSARNHAIFALSFFAGLRACEIAALKVGDVYGADGQVRDTIFLTAGQTKGDEANTVLVSKKLSKALAVYAAAYPRHTSKRDAPLFFSAKRGGFSAQTIVNLFARFYTLAGIKGASSHSGRRQFLTELADKGVNARVIQALARHKHLNTTMRYIDLNENKLRNAIELI